ncbi:MAG: putative DNA binding domain-containing protein [Desulfobacterales bacterium]|nr:putative DNA binding domain-containing protein [Desulfobacterales bacterium]
MKDENVQKLQATLDHLLGLPAETEWLEFKQASRTYPFDKVGRYFSALSNEARLKHQAAGWLVFGIQDKTHKITGTRFRPHRPDLDSLKKEIADKTSNLLTFTEIHELLLPEGRVLMFEIPPAIPGVPTAWEGHFYGRDGESIGALNLHELDLLRSMALPDWSGEICSQATLEDLDTAAIVRARELFKEKHPRLAKEVDSWETGAFLNKAKLLKNGHITNAAILLLGWETAEHHLSPSVAKISWILRDRDGLEKDYQHFGPPFLLNSDLLFSRIRNLTYRYMRNNTLFPTEVTQYDPWVIRELLHNCIAHQDYSLCGRITVVEDEESLLFSNMGSFLPQSVETVISFDAPPEYYRNQFLADAMVNLQMIDTIGSGIKRVFSLQRNRFFPMPDYDLADPQRVRVRLSGKILDENYTRLLISKTDLSLIDVIALDKVQKKKNLSDAEFTRLKRLKLIEGRRPNLFVSAHIAEAIHGKADYIRHRAFDKEHYKKLVLSLLKEFGPTSRKEINRLLLEKLPDILTPQQKENKIRNLLQEMSKKDGSIKPQGGPGWHTRWTLDGD